MLTNSCAHTGTYQHQNRLTRWTVKHQVVSCVHPSSLPLPFSTPEVTFAKPPQCPEDHPYFLPTVAFPHRHTPSVFPAYRQQSSHGAGTVRATLRCTWTSASGRGRELSPVPPTLDLAQQAPAMLCTRRCLKLNLRSVPIKDMAAAKSQHPKRCWCFSLECESWKKVAPEFRHSWQLSLAKALQSCLQHYMWQSPGLTAGALIRHKQEL